MVSPSLDYAMLRRPSTAPAPSSSSALGSSFYTKSMADSQEEAYFAFRIPDQVAPSQSQRLDAWQPAPYSQEPDYFSRFVGQSNTLMSRADTNDVPMLSSAESTTSTMTSTDDSPATPTLQDYSPPPESFTKPEGKILRPPNAWILYRSDKLWELKEAKATIKTPQAELSKMIGERWRSEGLEVKRKYELQALARKQEHDNKHPGLSTSFYLCYSFLR